MNPTKTMSFGLIRFSEETYPNLLMKFKKGLLVIICTALHADNENLVLPDQKQTGEFP